MAGPAAAEQAEVLALLVEPSDGFRLRPLAIDTGFLRKSPVYPFSIAGRAGRQRPYLASEGG